MAKIEGGAALHAFLAELIKKLEPCKLDVGFFSDAKYDPEKGGLYVASVAFWNEFGDEKKKRPPRPFFRRMISEHEGEWVDLIKLTLKKAGNDLPAAMELMGEKLAGDLKQSINDLVEPKLADSTRLRKGHDKPLIETAHMVNSVTHLVSK